MFGFRRGTGTFRYSVPNGMVVAATGHLSGVDPQGDGVVYTFIADTPSVFDFVAGPFTVQRREGPVPVSVYHLQPLVAAEEIVARAARIIAILEDEFGPYPFDELAIVEAPMGPAVYAGLEGGAYPGYFLVRSDLLRADGLEDWVVGHELTHFWFPHVVGHIDEAVAPAMLDEALAHYGALRVVEALSGPAAAEQFRRDGAKEAIRLTAAGLEHSLAGKTTTERWDRVAYNFSNTKGHLVYDMLARVVGRKRFQSALQAVIREHAGRDIAWTDFWQSIEAGAGQSIDWFSAQWLDSPFLPTLSVEWSQVDSDLKLEVRQSAPAFRLDVPFQVEFSDGTALLRTARVESETVPIEMETDKVVHAVRLDPHFTILHATPDQWAEAEARRFVTKGALLREDEDFDRALDMLRMGLEQVDEIDRSGVEFLLRLQIGWVHQDQGRLDEALTEYERALACAVRPADYLARLYLNLATIAADRGDHERVLWAAKNALAAERSLGKETEIGRQARQLRESDE
jgi:aminopeptidase N